MFFRRTVTLNIEPSSIRALTVEGKSVVRWASMPLEPGLVKDGLITDPAKVGSAIDALFSEKRIPKDRVVVSLTGLHSVTRVLDLPKLKPALQEEAIRNEAAREMPIPLEELYLFWQRMGASNTAERRFFVVGVPRNLIDAQLTALRRAGIKPRSMGLKPLALLKAVNQTEALIVDLEPNGFEVVVVADGIPVIMRTLAFRKADATAADKVRQLANEVSRVMDFYNNSRPERPLNSRTPIFLTGGLESDVEFKRLIGTSLDNPVRSLAPPLKYPSVLPASEYAVNLGLALKSARPKGFSINGRVDLPVAGTNVLPAQFRPNQISVKQILCPLAAVMSIALLLTSYMSVAGGDVEASRIQSQLQRVNLQLQEAKQAVASIQQVEAEVSKLEEEREAVLGTGDFADTLRLVMDAASADIHLVSISQMEDGRVNLSGTAESQQAVIVYAQELERSMGLSKPSISIEGTGPYSFKIMVSG